MVRMNRALSLVNVGGIGPVQCVSFLEKLQLAASHVRKQVNLYLMKMFILVNERRYTMTSVYLGKNLIAVPAERDPTMHQLFYRVAAFGSIRFMQLQSGLYRVRLHRPKPHYCMISIKKDFYDCLFELYKKLEALVIAECYSNNSLYYKAKNGKVYDKKCYNCVVEWLDDECSHEQERCDSCIIDGVCTKWEINQWCLDNNQLQERRLGI